MDSVHIGLQDHGLTGYLPYPRGKLQSNDALRQARRRLPCVIRGLTNTLIAAQNVVEPLIMFFKRFCRPVSFTFGGREPLNGGRSQGHKPDRQQAHRIDDRHESRRQPAQRVLHRVEHGRELRTLLQRDHDGVHPHGGRDADILELRRDIGGRANSIVVRRRHPVHGSGEIVIGRGQAIGIGPRPLLRRHQPLIFRLQQAHCVCMLHGIDGALLEGPTDHSRFAGHLRLQRDHAVVALHHPLVVAGGRNLPARAGFGHPGRGLARGCHLFLRRADLVKIALDLVQALALAAHGHRADDIDLHRKLLVAGSRLAARLRFGFGSLCDPFEIDPIQAADEEPEGLEIIGAGHTETGGIGVERSERHRPDAHAHRPVGMDFPPRRPGELQMHFHLGAVGQRLWRLASLRLEVFKPF